MDFHDALNTALSNMCYTSAGLVIGSSAASAVKVANTVTFTAAGVFKSKTTAEVAFTATTHNIPNNVSTVQEAVYVVGLSPTGTLTLTMGAIATGTGNALLPERVASVTPIGHVRVAVAAGSTLFTAGSDLLSAGHLTVTYTNVAFLFGRFDATQ